MNYELFDPSNSCNPILPLNDVTNNITFYKIVGLDYELNEIELNKSAIRNHQPVRLGLPLGLIFPYSQLYQTASFVQQQRFSIEVGKEGIFYPSKKTDKFNFIDIPLFDKDLDALSFKKGTFDIKLTPEQRKEIETYGFSLLKESNNIYNLRRASETFFVRDTQLSNQGITIDSNKIKLSASQSTELRTKGKITIANNGNNINLEYITSANTRLFSGNPVSFGPIIPMTLEECKTFARTIFPTHKMNNESYEEFLGELYLSPALGKSINDNFGVSSNNLNLKRFFAGLPYEARNSSFFENADLWNPFDLKKLKSYLGREGRHAAYIYKHQQASNETDLRRITNPIKQLKSIQLPKYELGVFTTYNQEWKLLGYSRGSLLSSLTLAPKEELSIEIQTYDKHKIENERTFSTEVEFNSEVANMEKASSKVMNELVDTTDSKAGLGFGVPVPAGNIPVEIKADGTINKNIKDTLTSSIENISDLTKKASEKIKSTSQIKIVQSHEFGEEKKVIRKISNPNNSRTLTFNHFEIVENYNVTTLHQVENLQPCLLIDNPFISTPIDLNFILAYEDKLAPAILNQAYINGFEAAKKLSAQRWFENKKSLDLVLQKLVEEEIATSESTATSEVIEKNIIRFAKQMRDILESFLSIDIPFAADIIFRDLNPAEMNKPSDDEVSNAEKTFGLASFWFKFKLAYPTIESKAKEFIQGLPENPNESTAFAALEKLVTGLDDEWLSSLKLVTIDIIAGAVMGVLAGPQFVLAAAAVAPILGQLLSDKNEGLPNLIDKIKKEVTNYQQMNSVVPVTVTTAVESSVPEEKLFSLNELAMAYAEFEKLVLHIEVNKAYYLNQIWLKEDSEVRFSRLKVQGLDKYIENNILGFVGNKAAFYLKLESLPDDYQEFLKTKILNKSTTPANSPKNPVTTTITVPTSGVYMESMLGKCEALEPNIIERLELERESVKLQNQIAKERLIQMQLENEKLKKSINNPGT